MLFLCLLLQQNAPPWLDLHIGADVLATVISGVLLLQIRWLRTELRRFRHWGIKTDLVFEWASTQKPEIRATFEAISKNL